MSQILSSNSTVTLGDTAQAEPTTEGRLVTRIVDNEEIAFKLDRVHISLGKEAYFDALLQQWDGFFLIYGTSDAESFDEIFGLHQRILRNESNQARRPVTLIADTNRSLCLERTVTSEQGSLLAAEIGAKYLEVNTGSGEKVIEAFEEMVRTVRRSERFTLEPES